MANPKPCSEHSEFDPTCPLCNLQDPTEVVCPDSAWNASARSCWVSPQPSPTDDFDVTQWLKNEMLNGLDHEWAHAVVGPALYGFTVDGIPEFEVYCDTDTKRWCVRPKDNSKKPVSIRSILG